MNITNNKIEFNLLNELIILHNKLDCNDASKLNYLVHFTFIHYLSNNLLNE
jgi:hypothetical protein